MSAECGSLSPSHAHPQHRRSVLDKDMDKGRNRSKGHF